MTARSRQSNDKSAVKTTLEMLPDLLQHHRGARLVAVADGTQISDPQALLVANNPYGTGDIAGLSRRARLDGGVLGVVGVNVSNAGQAAGLLRGAHATGLTVLTTQKIEVSANTPQIPVGIDGEAVRLPMPVQCTIRSGALRVWAGKFPGGRAAPRRAARQARSYR